MLGSCPLCALEYHPSEEIQILGCHPQHIMHKGCFELYVNFNKENNHPLYCPICRATIDELKTVNTQVELGQVEGMPPMEVAKDAEDNFGLPSGSPQTNAQQSA